MEFKFKKKSINQKGKKHLFENYSNVFKTNYENIKFIDIDRVANLDILPKENEMFFVMTRRNINSFEILDVINKQYKIKKVHASFNVFNKRGLELAEPYEFVNVVNSSKYSGVDEDFCVNKKKYSQHTKITLVECEGVNFTVNSSSNPKTSSRNESYIISRCDKMFENLLDFFEKQIKNENLKSLIPNKNEVINFISKKHNVFDFLKEVDEKEKILQIDILQYNYSIDFIKKFEDFLQGKNIKINSFISMAARAMNKGRGDFQLFYNKLKNISKVKDSNTTHCKMFVILTKDNHYITVSTANYFSCNKYEFTQIFNNEQLRKDLLTFLNDFFK